MILVIGGCSSASSDKIALIGDSITQLSDEQLHQALDGDYEVQIMGKFGARSDEVIKEVQLIAASKPSQVIINIGTNDATQQENPDTSQQVIQEIVDLFADADCITLISINEAITADGQPRTAEAQALNQRLTAIADAAENTSYLEWNEVIADNGGASAMTFDTVHLSPAGQTVMGETYHKALDGC